MGNNKQAMEAYELAAGWFESDNAEAYVIYDASLLTSTLGLIRTVG